MLLSWNILKEKFIEFAFERRERSRLPDVFGELVPDVGAEVWESAKAMGFAAEALEFELRLSDEERKGL